MKDEEKPRDPKRKAVQTPPFDPKAFLAKAEGEKTIAGYRERQIIFSQADPADSICYIQNGKIKLTVVSAQGKEAVVAILAEGAFFGEGCLAGQQLRMSTAVAMSECTIVRLERAATIRLLHDEPAFSELFLAYLLSATFGLRRIWWIICSTPVKSGWHGCCSCSPTTERSPSRSR